VRGFPPVEEGVRGQGEDTSVRGFPPVEEGVRGQGGELLTPNSSLLTPHSPLSTPYSPLPHSPTPPLYFEIPRNLSYAFGGLGILLVLAGVVAFAVGGVEIRKYATVVLALGLGWLILLLVWIGRYRFGQKFLTARYWIAGWLIPAWLALAVAGFNGFIGDYNPDVRAFLAQRAIASILQTNPINFVQVGGKTGLLLNFYTPHHGKQVQQVSELPPGSYAWISAKQPVSTPHQVLGTVQNYQLIQLGSGE
ncbi:hypothetical protein AABK37_37280, partial [Hassallia sp. VBCCA 56010]